jgi:hypothetical protein
MISVTDITQVIFYVPLLPDGNLLLVERADGRFYIIQNDEILKDRSWSKSEAPQALAAFNSLTVFATPKIFPRN